MNTSLGFLSPDARSAVPDLKKEKPRVLSNDLTDGREKRGDQKGLCSPSCTSTVSGSASLCNPEEGLSGLLSLLTPYHRKAAYALAENVSSLVAASGLERVGFLTLTFPDNVADPKEAYSRFKSFNSNFLASHPGFGDWLCAKERQKRGAWHYHLLIDCRADIRTDVDFFAFASGDYRSAGQHLRSLWADLRESLPKYGFGRHELMPVISNAQAMGRYVGKYISKHIHSRKPEDKGVRLTSYSRKWPRSSTHFQWNTANSYIWRQGVEILAEFLDCEDFEELKKKLGPDWAWRYRESIARREVPAEVLQELESCLRLDDLGLYDSFSKFLADQPVFEKGSGFLSCVSSRATGQKAGTLPAAGQTPADTHP